jgi:signal transduction histidine kinase
MKAPMGVGMAGMLERTRDMGGSFDVQSGSSGTTLTIVIPVSDVKATRSAGPEESNAKSVA